MEPEVEEEEEEIEETLVGGGGVLYEIRRHATMDLPSESPRSSGGSSSGGGLLSHLSFGGVNQLRQRWSEYRRPKASRKKSVSLFVSPDGEHVAVAAGSKITILQKDDDYMEPCGVFTCIDKERAFISGVWLEPLGVIGIIDDLNTLYFIRSNGMEITRRTRSQFKLSAPIIDLFVQKDIYSKNSCLCVIHAIAEDGLIHCIEITEEFNMSIYQSPAPSGRLHLPPKVACLDFHLDLSLAAIVCNSSMSGSSNDSSGNYSLYILRITEYSDVELLVCGDKLEGLFASQKGCLYDYSHPKVAISPHAKHVATLDFLGCVDVLKLDVERQSLSLLSFTAKQQPEKATSMALGKKKYFFDIVDITWWTDDILILANMTGCIFMFDILNCLKVSENDPRFCMPLIERVKHGQGHAFLLENKSSASDASITPYMEHKTLQMKEDSSGNFDKQDTDKSCWSLMSLFERSASEMYTILIKSHKYQSALEFASNHHFDTDEVFKAQWLDSSKGIPDINLYLSQVKDLMFVLSECVNRVGTTEEIVQALLYHGLCISDQHEFSDFVTSDCSSKWNIRMLRLQLLQFRDRLETFMGINMGRFSAPDYCKFRSKPLTEAAIVLAESSKIGALNLLFKRHPYSVSPKILDILASIPETVPIETYCQLLPGTSPPGTIALRDADWVECEEMLSFLNTLQSKQENRNQIFTENLLRLSTGYIWPSISELSLWYKNRSKDIDDLSGQLNNCLSLIEFGCRNGILELQQLLEDISYLHQIIYSDGFDEEFSMSLVTWEQLPDYEKFKIMLKGVKEDAIVKRLQETAIPFMQNRFSKASDLVDETRYGDRESFLVRWLKEIASLNQLDLCLAVIENGCGDSPVDGLFKDEVEIIETALYCIYSCSLTDQWNMMASILSKLPRNILRDNSFVADNNFSQRSNYEVENSKGSFVMYGLEGSTLDDSRRTNGKLDTDASIDKLEKRIKVAEGHIEVGRLMAYYQVPKPISFFLGAQSDEKNVKQLLRLILSKFSRRQPARSDNDWASMWRDLLSFQEKAFPFLDLEYILIEFTRGLLKAGKFSLARNYLKGTASVSLATTKAENLVIQAARDYFFSASSLSCSEIWKAKECLSLFPSSKAVKAEADMIDALTVRLPNLGVSLLPMQFRQIRNPMEIINMVIASQTGAYLNVEELVEIAKLLGLGSPDDIATVEEAVAREAAVAGDLPLAFDLCLVLAKKGHGSIWDLCAAIARGPNLDNMDQTSRKQLLGFALSHCDDESIGDLLNAWKEVDTHVQTEQLITLTGESPRNLFSSSLSENCTNEIFYHKDDLDLVEHGLCLDGVEVQHNQIKDALSKVGTDLVSEDGIRWDTILQENKKVLSFAVSELPWLLELSGKEEYGKLSALEAKFSFIRHQVSMQMRALLCILCWMAGNNIIPHDDTIKSLAKSIMQPPTAEEDDILGCSFLLNLLDAFHGVDIIEDQLKRRNRYQEIYSIMNIGMAYSSLNNAQKKCSSPEKRRELLLQMFHNKQASFCSDEKDHIDKVQSTFWREWKSKLEEQKRLAEHARELEQIIPGIESARFLSRDMDYIKGVLFSFIDTIKLEKKHILKEAVKLADTYGLDRIEVILHFFACALVSEQWENNDILAEISEYRNDIVQCAKGVIDMIRTVVYPEIDGRNKQRLCYMYSILSACCLRLSRVEDLKPTTYQEGHVHILEPFQFYKVLEQECQRVSFIKDLNFKNIAGLYDLNFDHFNEEICNNIHENSVEALAVLVQSLVGIYDKSQAKGLISMEDVYKHHVLGLLASLDGRNEAKTDGVKADELQELLMEIEMNYDKCKMYLGALPEMNILYVFRRFLLVCFPHNFLRSLPEEPQWKECLIVLLTFWIKLVDDVPEKLAAIISGENPLYTATNNLLRCLKVFRRLVVDDQISANQGWDTISNYVRHGLVDGLISDISSFLIAMIFSGCAFKSIAEACYEAVVSEISSRDSAVKYLLDIYINIVDKVLADINMELDRHRNLHRMLSSLSRSAGNHEEDLKMIRLEVWEKLRAFSDNMQFASHTRLYSLQLMQCITGINLKSLPAELISEVEPWEGWDESISMKATATSEGADIPNSVTSTFVALKSTQIVSAIFPDIEITPENMMTLDSAVSCFLHLSERITSAEHLSVLQVVLEEWEEFFSIKTDKEGTNESPKESNNWSSDEWDEGWEELVSAEAKQKGSVSIRPLHICWMEIIKRLIGFSELRLVMELLDKSTLKSDYVLLDEDEAQCLFQMVVGTDCFMALKLLLLLPYEAPRSQCLRVLEDKLKRGSISDASSADNYDTLVLLLSSGLVRVIATDPSLCKVFSYICYLVGILARNSQDDMLNLLEVNGNRPKQKQPSPFISVLLPFFISELVCGGQPLMAGFIVSRWMHSHVCLSLIDVVEASLRRYLEQQVLQVQDLVGHGYAPADDTSQSLMYSYSCLRSKLHNQLQSALLALTR